MTERGSLIKGHHTHTPPHEHTIEHRWWSLTIPSQVDAIFLTCSKVKMVMDGSDLQIIVELINRKLSPGVKIEDNKETSKI